MKPIHRPTDVQSLNPLNGKLVCFRPNKIFAPYITFSEPLFCINMHSLYIYTFSGRKNRVKIAFFLPFSPWPLERSARDHLRGDGLTSGHLTSWPLERSRADHFGACLVASPSDCINIQKSSFLQGLENDKADNSTNAGFITFVCGEFYILPSLPLKLGWTG